jgi:hypothetical protein
VTGEMPFAVSIGGFFMGSEVAGKILEKPHALAILLRF